MEVLVLSVDEYKGRLNYGEFEQLYPVSASPAPQKPTAASAQAGRREETDPVQEP